MANLAYYTVFGGNVFYENLRTSIESLRDIGRYDGEILVFSDREFRCRGSQNIILPLADAPESVAIRITCHRHFDFAPYDRVLFLDSDIVANRDVSPLFAYPESFSYFPQDDRYFTTGIIDALYFDAALWRKHWWKHPLNAGQFVLAGQRFADFMREWEAVCDRFALRRVYGMNTSFKKTWRDQVALNYLLRTGITGGAERIGAVYYPLSLLALRPFPVSRHAFFPRRHILWHFGGIPAPLAGRMMRRRLTVLRERF